MSEQYKSPRNFLPLKIGKKSGKRQSDGLKQFLRHESMNLYEKHNL